MELEDSGLSLNPNSFNELESSLGAKLPDSYKKFMLEHNGGTPAEDLVYDFFDEVKQKKNTTDIRGFYILYDDITNNYDDIAYIYKTMKDEKIIPDRFLPIGDDSGGNPFGMLLMPNEYGKIFFVNHEIENRETGYLAMSKIADSFTEFVSKLYLM